MFDSFNNIKTTYQVNPYAPQYPPQKMPTQIVQNNPNKPYEVVDARGVLTGYFWYYGNSVDLTWDIVGEATSAQNNTYIDVADIVKYQIITATIYDWKMCKIAEVKLLPTVEDNKASVTLSISGELSQKLVKGVYEISLTASNTQGYNETLFDTGVCKFEVR